MQNDFKGNQHAFLCEINEKNMKRLSPLLIFVAIISGVQAILYGISSDEAYQDLIAIKILIVVSVSIIVILFKKISVSGAFFQKYSEKLIFGVVLWVVLLSIVNSFYAQKISSDISIFIMVLFIVVAGIRMRRGLFAIIFLISYLLLVLGMPFFQPNKEFLLAHQINGGIINVIAYMISTMFYQYSVKDFMDQLKIISNNELLKNLSERDSLTGLYNKRTINELLDSFIKEDTEKGEQLYLGILDLDKFKEINDHFGHAYGDEVLKIIADKIIENIRDEDIAGRYGGDEFMIVFKDSNSERIQNVMQRLLNEINLMEFKDSKLSFSCGVAVWNGETRNELFERADKYMYEIKHTCKNDIKFEKIRTQS